MLTDDDPLARRMVAAFEGKTVFLPPDELHDGVHSALRALVIDAPNTPEALLNRGEVLGEVARLDASGVSVISLGHVSAISRYFRAIIDLYPSQEVHSANYYEGPDYLILRPEFARAPVVERARSGTPRDLLVAMGGSDPHNLTETALSALGGADFDGHVHVVLGAGYPHVLETDLRARQATWPFTVTFHRDVEQIIDLMRGVDAAVVAFGTTAYELMSQGVPVLAITHYRWQEPSAVLFAELGCCRYLGCAQDGLHANRLGERIADALENPDRLFTMGGRGREIVDGCGGERVADLLMGLVREDEDHKLDILYVLAHPGDELLGCGGTLLRQVAEGARVGLLVLGEGVSSRRSEGEGRASALVARREIRSALQNVVDEIALPVWYYYRFADNRFDTHDLLDLVKVIESICRRHLPEVVYTHHPGDLNVDHRRTYEAVVTALRPMADQAARRLFSIEVPSSTDWGAQLGRERFEPNWFVDVSTTLERKLELVRHYASELRDDPHPRSVAGLRDRARHWGRLAGLPAAEVMVLQRHVERAHAEL